MSPDGADVARAEPCIGTRSQRIAFYSDESCLRLKMPKYVVISNHPPMSCPSANKTLRKLGNELGNDLPKMLKKHKIKPEVMLHLDPGHKIVWVVEAPTAESVRDFAYDSGLARWNDFEFYMASSLDEVTSWIQHLPTIW